VTRRPPARDTVVCVSASSVGGAQAPDDSGAQAPDDSRDYPGAKFGLPRDGARSVASMARRLAALLIDWVVCMLIAQAAFHNQYWTLAIFAVMTFVLTALTGLTIGKRLTGIRVVRLDGKPVGFAGALVRTLLLVLVVPPLVTDRDLRGLHDRAANTIVIRI
jgi:uncharacterized RDD family membrane protein YckC